MCSYCTDYPGARTGSMGAWGRGERDQRINVTLAAAVEVILTLLCCLESAISAITDLVCVERFVDDRSRAKVNRNA